MFVLKSRFFFYLSIIIFSVLVFYPTTFTQAKTINLGTASDIVSIPGRVVNDFLVGEGNRCLYVTPTGDLGAKAYDCGSSTGGDDLGSHSATQNIELNTFWLSGNGRNEGVFVNSTGQVGVNTSNPSQQLEVKAKANTEALRLISASDWSPLNIRNSTDSADIFRISQLGVLETGSVPWARLTNFPHSCGAGQYVSAVGQSLTCSTPPGGSDIYWTGTSVNLNATTGRASLGLGTLATLSAVSGGTGGTITDRTIANIDISDSADIAATKLQYGEYFITSPGASGQIWTSDGSGAGYWDWQTSLGVGGDITGSGTTNYIPVWSGTSALADSPIYKSGNNVGIGTTNPSNLLEVHDLISFTNLDFRTQIGYQAGKYDLGQFNTWIGFQAGSANNSTGKTNAADFNTAVGSLSLYANTTGVGNSAYGYTSLSYNTSGNYNTVQGSQTLVNNTTGDYNVALGYNAGSKNADNSNRVTGDYGLYLGANTKAAGNETTNEIVLGYNTTGQGSYTAVYGNSSMTKHVFTNGNIGIGTTNPGHKLDVKGATNVGISVSSSDSADNPYIQLAGEGGNITTEGMKIYYVDSQPNTFFDSMFNNDSYGFRFRTKVSGTPVNALTILGSGNVGIGITNPGTKLDVNGSLRSTGAVTLSLLAGTGNRMVIADASGTLSTQAISAALPAGSTGQTLRYNGSWVGSSLLYNNGTTIGINNTSPSSSYKLDVTGAGYFSTSVTSANFYYSSDRKLKKNIKPLDDSLAKIMQLEGVSFDWKKDDKAGIGLIAQDVALVFPELVASTDGSLSVQYANLVAPLIEAVKTQQLEIERLTERLESLENKL